MYVQELYLDGALLSYLDFHIRCGMAENRKEQKVTIGVAANTRGRLIVEARTDVIHHLYIMMLDLKELDLQRRKKKKRVRVVNTYNNNI